MGAMPAPTPGGGLFSAGGSGNRRGTPSARPEDRFHITPSPRRAGNDGLETLSSRVVGSGASGYGRYY